MQKRKQNSTRCIYRLTKAVNKLDVGSSLCFTTSRFSVDGFTVRNGLNGLCHLKQLAQKSRLNLKIISDLSAALADVFVSRGSVSQRVALQLCMSDPKQSPEIFSAREADATYQARDNTLTFHTLTHWCLKTQSPPTSNSPPCCGSSCTVHVQIVFYSNLASTLTNKSGLFEDAKRCKLNRKFGDNALILSFICLSVSPTSLKSQIQRWMCKAYPKKTCREKTALSIYNWTLPHWHV